MRPAAFPRPLRVAAAAVLLAASFGAGYLAALGHARWKRPPVFHDIRVTHVRDLVALVDPRDPAVAAAARKLATPEAAYAFVRDRILYVPAIPTDSPGETLRAGQGSCLAKATLLCSLYRALGMSENHVRVVTGNVALGDFLTDHAWVDLEIGNRCLQQDPSGLLGAFPFDQFPGTEFSRAFVHEEDFCFNDKGFAVVSQLNRFRDGLPPGMPPVP